jgi:hypothetical protein
MHNRFVLTGIGGVFFNTGAEQNEESLTGTSAHELVGLLGQSAYPTECATYSGHQAYRFYCHGIYTG